MLTAAKVAGLRCALLVKQAFAHPETCTELSCLLRSWVYLTPEESFLTGKFLEHTWAMIFGEPAVLMPVPECELLDCNVHGGQQRIHGFSLGATETSS